MRQELEDSENKCQMSYLWFQFKAGSGKWFKGFFYLLAFLKYPVLWNINCFLFYYILNRDKDETCESYPDFSAATDDNLYYS